MKLLYLAVTEIHGCIHPGKGAIDDTTLMKGLLEKPDFETASFDGQSATAAAISGPKRQEWRYSEDQTGTAILGGR